MSAAGSNQICDLQSSENSSTAAKHFSFWPQRTAYKIITAIDNGFSTVHGDAWQCVMEIAIGLYRRPISCVPLYVLIVTDESQEVDKFALGLKKALGRVSSDDPGWNCLSLPKGQQLLPKRNIKLLPDCLTEINKTITNE
jgi:hypothetical protein